MGGAMRTDEAIHALQVHQNTVRAYLHKITTLRNALAEAEAEMQKVVERADCALHRLYRDTQCPQYQLGHARCVYARCIYTRGHDGRCSFEQGGG